MEHVSIARVALAAATYAIDRPYDYQIPQELEGRAAPGVRVIVPFGAGNRRTEGLILALTDETRLEKKIKAVLTVLDDAPVLGAAGIKLALWVRDRFFCTVYDAARAMLPAGLWFSIQDSYRVAEGVDRERSYDAAGRSDHARRILDLIWAAGGRICGNTGGGDAGFCINQCKGGTTYLAGYLQPR